MLYLITILLTSLIYADLLKPINNSLLNQTHILFEWEQEFNNDYYILDISESSDNIDQECIVCDYYISESLIHIQKELIEWDKTYYWKIVSYDNNGESNLIGTSLFSTGPPISNASTIEHTNNNQDGLTIFGSFFDYYSAVIDKDGNEIWNSGNQDLIFYNTDEYGRFFGAEYIGNNAENNYPGVKFSFENGIEWQEPGQNFIHHDIFQLPNGNYLGLGTSTMQGPIPLGPWTGLFQGLGYVADGETIEFEWMGDKIIEWDAETKEEVWTWNVFDHYNMGDFDELGGIWFEAYNTNRFDWTHSNAIWFDEDDSAIYLSARHLSRITKIDYPNGNIIWNLGHEMQSGDIDCGQDIGFSFQHSITKLENGNILTFDNGNLSREYLDQENKTSRSIEIDIEETIDGCNAQLGWEYILPENLYGYLSGNTQKLDNGNYLSTTIGGGGTSVEVDGNGDLIWESSYNLSLPDGLVYRAMRIPGIFPIAYSVIFPQMTIENAITLDNDSLNVLIKNSGDYKQKFNYNLIINSENNSDYAIDLIISPEHHSNQQKYYSYNINSVEPIILENQNGDFILDANEEIILTFINEITLSNSSNNLDLSFTLEEPYPNPFNPIVNIELSLASSNNIKLNIYNLSGEKIDDLFLGLLNKGKYRFTWDATYFSSGTYFVKLESDNNFITKKLFLIK
tara:strand:- start:639 stop:2681 length:2043 start_codon:yes stop_codon:yes gene_type:complete